eukprot:NODE_3255_length_578_cov_126.801512_g2740_i0.p3 GENE.NODE_3255_length_578_cov_126.801512_g2740_i0~~NODE_3255_length_578_cov_126.801512_g2740_i0.p3  ORF type:complete len:55 (+),score=5.77 NODE_3255_length_578_cov_126.801512_g2740_i0:192-356(+)
MGEGEFMQSSQHLPSALRPPNISISSKYTTAVCADQLLGKSLWLGSCATHQLQS